MRKANIFPRDKPLNSNAIEPDDPRPIMKHISASIIVVAGAVIIHGASHISHMDQQMFVILAGCVVCAAGLAGWFAGLKEK